MIRDYVFCDAPFLFSVCASPPKGILRRCSCRYSKCIDLVIYNLILRNTSLMERKDICHSTTYMPPEITSIRSFALLEFRLCQCVHSIEGKKDNRFG